MKMICLEKNINQIATIKHILFKFQVPEGYRKVCTVECPVLLYDAPGTTYSCVEIVSDNVSLYVGTFENLLLKYIVKDCDPNTGKVLDDEVG